MSTRILNPEWMPDAEVEAIVLHWTGGTRAVSNLDLKHYHFIIPENCQVKRGHHSITDNLNLRDNDYAAHVLNFNAFEGRAVIGVSICGMGGAHETPFRPGAFPIIKAQWQCAALVVADLCERYGVAVDKKHVLQHGEVQANRGVTQRGKWDINRLPFARSLTKQEVHDQFREMVKEALTVKARDKFPALSVIIDGQPLAAKGLLQPGHSLIPLRPLAEHLQWTIVDTADDEAILTLPGGKTIHEPLIILDGEGFVGATSLALTMGWPTPAFEGSRRRVLLTT